MNKIITWVKSNWKIVVIVLLSFMFLNKCNSSNNYERKYKKEVKYVEYVIDSLNTVHSNSTYYIDSLNHVIKERDAEIGSLKKLIDVYTEQNSELINRNKALANKPVIVNIENKKETE